MARRLLGCVLLLAAVSLAQSQPSTGSISGLVVDALGDPVVLAEVSVSRWNALDEPLLTKRTDGSGAFVLAGLPIDATTLRVRAKSNGRVSVEGFVVLRGESPSAFQQLRLWDAAAIRGRVVDPEGRPIPGASVCAQYDFARAVRSSDNRLEATTDGEGRFALDAVPLGWISVRAWASGHSVGSASVRLSGEPAELALELPRGDGVTMRVQVAGLEGEARAHVSLRPYHAGALRNLPRPLVTGTVGAKDVWTVRGLPDWEFAVQGSAVGYVFDRIDSRAKPVIPNETITLRCVREGSVIVRGSLADAGGKALAGQTLVCHGRDGGREARTITGADGSFELTVLLMPGTSAACSLVGSTYVLARTKPASAPHMHEVREPVHEFVVDAATRLELRAERGAIVRGRVVDGSGQPVAGSRVELQEGSANRIPRWMWLSSCTSDANGNFEITGLRAPACDLRVALGKLDATAGEPFQLEPGATIDKLVLVKQPDGSVEGTVKDATGAPIPGARVWLRNVEVATGRQTDGSVNEVLTNREGRYRHTEVEPGGHRLELMIGNVATEATFRGEPFEVAPGQRVAADLVAR